MKEALLEMLTWTLWLLAVVVLAGVLVLTLGCTSASYQQQEARALGLQGCYCEGKGCRVMTSATGKAAGIAAGTGDLSVRKVEGRQ